MHTPTQHNSVQKQKPLYFLLGLLIAQSFVFLSFEWKIYSPLQGTLLYEQEDLREIDFIEALPPNIPQPNRQVTLSIHATDHVFSPVLDDMHPIDNTRGLDDDIKWLSDLTEGLPVFPILSSESKIESINTDPVYPGGMEAFHAWFLKSFVYPEEAKRYEVEGTIWISFYVDEKGNVTHVFADPNRPLLGYGLEEEAIRVLRKMHAWKPGYANSRPVGMAFTLPIQLFIDRSY